MNDKLDLLGVSSSFLSCPCAGLCWLDRSRSWCREPPFERVPGLYAALLMSADAMDANDMTGVRGPKQSCFVDIEKVRYYEWWLVMLSCGWRC